MKFIAESIEELQNYKVIIKSKSLNESKSGDFAKSELDLLIKTCDDAIVKEFIPEIIALVDKFGDSGQSGGSAPYTSHTISDTIAKLCMFKPISPVTGNEDEWNNVQDEGRGTPIVYQNKRASAIFKDEDNKPYYLDAIIFKDEEGLTFFGSAQLSNGKKIDSRQYIKQFPFQPKTFYVDVNKKEISPDDWEYHIKDESQLDEVFEYYDKFIRS
jgi:hypothetical protein